MIRDSGWVFVEEQNINSLLLDSVKIIRNCMMIVLLGCVLAAMLAYVRGKQVTNVLVDFTDQISNMPADRLSDIQVTKSMRRIHVLGTAFNECFTACVSWWKIFACVNRKSNGQNMTFCRPRSIRISE